LWLRGNLLGFTQLIYTLKGICLSHRKVLPKVAPDSLYSKDAIIICDTWIKAGDKEQDDLQLIDGATVQVLIGDCCEDGYFYGFEVQGRMEVVENKVASFDHILFLSLLCSAMQSILVRSLQERNILSSFKQTKKITNIKIWSRPILKIKT
ncbi:hypothetical protein ACJX0J_030561, partial [Zea mays]